MPSRSAFDKLGVDTVIKFKASVDELSRLCAGRSEDEQLVAQLDERLQSVSASVAARLLLECRFREEWREERSAKALDSIPCASGDPQAVDRMREYVSMLAPQQLYGSSGEAWQHELLKQQQAIASILQLCPSNSPDVVMRTLTDFMSHSHKRLSKRLDLVQWKVSEQQNRRWEAAERAASLPGSPLQKAGDQAAVLTADAFLERLQRQRAAVCALQTRVRGRQQVVRFRLCLGARLASAIRLQALARHGAARRLAEALRETAVRARRQGLAERHSARRLQRAWRWAVQVRLWGKCWRSRMRVAELGQLQGWRQHMRRYWSGGLHKSASEEDFSSFASYVPGTRIRERRQAEHCGVRMLQASARGMRDRRVLREALRAVVCIQAAWRSWHARTRLAWWRRALRTLHEVRAAQLRWSALVSGTRRLLPLQTRAVLVELNVAKELNSVQVRHHPPGLPVWVWVCVGWGCPGVDGGTRRWAHRRCGG